jgi:hypothetical protein
MSDVRDPRGRFKKGYCPNPKGRPRRRTDWSLPAQFRHFILDRANQPVRVNLPNGKKEKMTLFETRVLRLASVSGRNRRANKAFIDLVLQAAGQQEQVTRNTEALPEFDDGVPQFLHQDEGTEGELFYLWLESIPAVVRAMSDDELIERLTGLGRFRPQS